MKRYKAKHMIVAYIGATRRTWEKGEVIDLPADVIEQKLGLRAVEPVEDEEPEIEDEEDPWR